MSLLVIVPTRQRRETCERLMDSFEKTTDNAELLFVTDSDDDSYEDMDWRGHRSAVIDPRGCLVEKLNRAVAGVIGESEDPIMWLGDDHVFVTEHWDTLMLEALEDLGGSGWVYPNDLRRADVPETWLCSRDVIRTLGWYANPVLKHYFIDNSIADLAKRANLIRYCPDVIIAHHHYSVDPETERDDLYRETERNYGDHDMKAFQEWRSGSQVAMEVSRLRRKFNPDVQWVLGKV